MKTLTKNVLLAIAFLLPLHTQAQQFDWAKSYGAPSVGNVYRACVILNTFFDCEGNSYIFGTAGPSASIDSTLLYPENFGICSANFLAKFDPDGNLLWHKSVGSSFQQAFPHWMELVGDTAITVSFCIAVGRFCNFWFIDTLVTGTQISAIPESERQLPFDFGYYTGFLTFDLDGNLIEQHYVQISYPFLFIDTIEYFTLSMSLATRSHFHIDKDGNIYVFAKSFLDSAFGEAYPVKIIVDKEKEFSFCQYNNSFLSLKNWRIFKFSPDFDFIWQKEIYTGASEDLETVDYSYRISCDQDDNMYLSGAFNINLPNTFQYPIYLYLDSLQNHFIRVDDVSSASVGQNFLIKFDTFGNVQWNTQLYTEIGSSSGYSASSFSGSYVDNNEQVIYIEGMGETGGTTSLRFNDGTILSKYSESNFCRAFFAKLDLQTGEHISHGVPPCNHVSGTCEISENPVRLSNRVFANTVFPDFIT